MNCANCGAPMDVSESGDHLRCHHCGTYGFPDASHEDGIRVLGRVPGAPACPVCTREMDAAVLDGSPIHYCAQCRGILLPRPVFAGTVNKRRAWATDPPKELVPLDRRCLERKLGCPSCRGTFETFPHYGPGNVVIDNCPRCDLIWLDYGEMRRIVDAPGRDRGTQHVPRIDPAYIRTGDRSSEDSSPDDPVRGLLNLLLEGW